MPHITSKDILYSFRRCPYAMRARLALIISGADPQIREIELKNKPTEMIQASPKATVPVLVLHNEGVIDESYDIMRYALQCRDPHNWLNVFSTEDSKDAKALIEYNDTIFKKALDRYKYPNRFTAEGIPENIKTAALITIKDYFSRLEALLSKHNGSALFQDFSITDAAILPFIRQAAHVDKAYFYALPFPYLQKYLEDFLSSELFMSIMPKLSPWSSTKAKITLQKIQS